MVKIKNILNYNKIKICTIILIFYFIIIFENTIQPTILNENLELIIEIVEKFLNPNNKPILSQNEQLISNYWNEKSLCPFSKLISYGLTKKEALLIIDFFKIESIEDLTKLKEFLNNIKK